MTLKHTFDSRPNPAYSEAEITKLTKVELKLRKAKEDISHADAGSDDYLANVKSTIDDNLKQARAILKKKLAQPKVLKEVHIKSEKTWILYPEFIGDDCGSTRYSPGVPYSVDIRVPYEKENDEGSRTAIKKAQENALHELKEYRRKRKEIPSMTKSFNVKGMPVQPTYLVYAGNGYGGPARTDTYRDVLRGTVIQNEIPEGKDNYFIHLKGGTFLELQNAAKCRVIFEEKKPMTNAHHVGVEIEFVSKFDKFQLAVALCDEQVQKFVCLKDDGSIRTDKEAPEYKFRHELCIVAPEAIIHDVLNRTLRALNKDKGSRVGGRCGLHVHLDMRNRDKKKCFYNLSKAQKIFYAMNPASRLTGKNEDGDGDTNYSKRLDFDDFDAARSYLAEVAGGAARYHGVNILSLEKHGTIEIRIHSGSTNYDKISNWVTILTKIVNQADKVVEDVSTPDTFCTNFGLDNTMLEYISKRIATFKDKQGRHITLKESA